MKISKRKISDPLWVGTIIGYGNHPNKYTIQEWLPNRYVSGNDLVKL